MSFDFEWENYLYLAKLLNGDPTAETCTPEGMQRAAISRAYYAALIKARDYLIHYEPNKYRRTQNESHNDIIHPFLYHSESKRQGIGTNLDLMRMRRRAADYDTAFPRNHTLVNLKESAKFNIGRSRAVIDALTALVKEFEDS